MSPTRKLYAQVARDEKARAAFTRECILAISAWRQARKDASVLIAKKLLDRYSMHKRLSRMFHEDWPPVTARDVAGVIDSVLNKYVGGGREKSARKKRPS